MCERAWGNDIISPLNQPLDLVLPLEEDRAPPLSGSSPVNVMHVAGGGSPCLVAEGQADLVQIETEPVEVRADGMPKGVRGGVLHLKPLDQTDHGFSQGPLVHTAGV